MPIYEYLCRTCGHQFEKLIRTAAAATVTCEKCGDPRVDKQFSTFGVSTGGTPGGPADAPPSCGRCGANRPPCGSGEL